MDTAANSDMLSFLIEGSEAAGMKIIHHGDDTHIERSSRHDQLPAIGDN